MDSSMVDITKVSSDRQITWNDFLLCSMFIIVIEVCVSNTMNTLYWPNNDHNTSMELF